jgi:hypothetical protein
MLYLLCLIRIFETSPLVVFQYKAEGPFGNSKFALHPPPLVTPEAFPKCYSPQASIFYTASMYESCGYRFGTFMVCIAYTALDIRSLGIQNESNYDYRKCIRS